MKFIVTFLVFSILIILTFARSISSEEGSKENDSSEEKMKSEIERVRNSNKSLDGDDCLNLMSVAREKRKTKKPKSSSESNSSESHEKSSEVKDKVETSTIAENVADETTTFLE